MNDPIDRKYRYLASYAELKKRLIRLCNQREEYIILKGRSLSYAPISEGTVGDQTGNAASELIDSIDRINYKISECYKRLKGISAYIERANISEREKLIITCKFVRGMPPRRIAEEIEEDYNGRDAMRKRIKRIIEKMPEIKNTPSR